MKKPLSSPIFLFQSHIKAKQAEICGFPPIPTLDNMGQVHFLVLRIHIRLFYLFISTSRMRRRVYVWEMKRCDEGQISYRSHWDCRYVSHKGR